jgi:hypothetical protein
VTRELESDLQRWVDEALPSVQRFEQARRALAALRGEKYEPYIRIVGVLPEPEPEPKRQRGPYIRLTPEALRDWAVEKGRTVGRFTRPEMVEELGVSPTTATNKSNELVTRGWFRPERNGRTLVFSYVPPQEGGPGGPKAAAKQKAGRSNGHRAVPGTGRPAGPASTPGALKRQQRKAKIVKPKPVKGVRV